MSEEKFSFVAQFPDQGQPYKPHADGSGVLQLQIPELFWDIIPELHKAGRGHALKVLVVVEDNETFGEKAA